ncbi:2-oxoacid:acceptor oxidoreductase family protein [Vallitalea sp.]|jgi:pyruvate ferredoxin oxidoreductase gamma subunit|uniref:2-oxoacid:acceptor oxidoreductase family protein n=1 Tax=Vallitalea sp. TaxID=1882829 RepID=UPI0025E7380D|nr:2-oxoacid:acceptor oxidoreductase family protein [Vallitalea sp.]MCT4687938.1 2-oxoacid:acceptor oxidoreductase family protein [Vallitalea sp.]
MSVNLPVTNEHGFYEIRLESIGGLGANLIGKILGELGALYLDLNSSNFASYGSEKKGTPVKAFIRYCDPNTEIRINSPIEKPHVLGIFHENLAGKIPVMAGVDKSTMVVVNTNDEPDVIRDRLKMHAGTLICVDALKISLEEHTRINMVLLGAIGKATGFISLDSLEQVVKETIGKKYPAALEGNLAGVKRGYEEITIKKYNDDGKYPYQEYKEVKRDWGYANAPIGGVNTIPGSTVTNDLSASRQGYVPIFHVEKCIHCGLCDTTCPDMVFQFVEGKYKGKPAMVNKGLDYHHCKGCLRCVEVCPTAALTAEIERDIDIHKLHVRNKDLIAEQMEFQDTGANSIVNTESGN